MDEETPAEGHVVAGDSGKKNAGLRQSTVTVTGESRRRTTNVLSEREITGNGPSYLSLIHI